MLRRLHTLIMLSILVVVSGCSGSSNQSYGPGFVDDVSHLPKGLQVSIQRLQASRVMPNSVETYRTDYLFGDRIVTRFSRLETKWDDLCAILQTVHEIDSAIVGVQQFRGALPKEWQPKDTDETRYFGSPSWVSGEPKVDVFVLRVDPKDDYLYMYYLMFHVAAGEATKNSQQ